MSRKLVTTSDRFDLVQVLPSDEKIFLFMYQDPGMMEHLGGPMTDENALARFQKWIDMWKNDGIGPCLVRSKATGEIVGGAAIFRAEVEGEPVFEIGWSVLPPFQRQGIAFEASKAILDHGVKELGAKVITAFPNETNKVSNRLCEKLGMKRIKVITYPYGGGSLNSVYWRRDIP